MNNNNNENNEEETGFLRAFFLQSDWSGPVAQGTWEGRHGVWRRVAFFSLASATLLSAEGILAPMLPSKDDQKPLPFIFNPKIEEADLQSLRASHKVCLDAVQNVASALPLDCHVSKMDHHQTNLDFYLDAHTNFTRLDEKHGSDFEYVPLPTECRDAWEESFGSEWGDIELLHFHRDPFPLDGSGPTNQTKKSLFTVLPDCSLQTNTEHILPAEKQAKDANRTLGIPISMMRFLSSPHLQENDILSHVFTLDKVEAETKQKILNGYDWFMKQPTALLAIAALLYWIGVPIFHFTTAFWLVVWLLVRSILPAMVARRVLSWPEETTTKDVWRGMVLLGVISALPLQGPLLSSVLTAGAYLYYRDSKAAVEWAFVGFLAWGAPFLAPRLDPVVELTFLGSVAWMFRPLLSALVVGEGWWKLVSIYVFARSYLSLQGREDAPEDEVLLDAVEADVAAAALQEPLLPDVQEEGPEPAAVVF